MVAHAPSQDLVASDKIDDRALQRVAPHDFFHLCAGVGPARRQPHEHAVGHPWQAIEHQVGCDRVRLPNVRKPLVDHLAHGAPLSIDQVRCVEQHAIPFDRVRQLGRVALFDCQAHPIFQQAAERRRLSGIEYDGGQRRLPK